MLLSQELLKTYTDQYDNWSREQWMEHWCVMVGCSQRLLPATVWQWWMTPNIDWWSMTRKNLASEKRAPRAADIRGRFCSPVSNFLGDSWYAVVEAGAADSGNRGRRGSNILNSFCQVRDQKHRSLHSDLETALKTQNHLRLVL